MFPGGRGLSETVKEKDHREPFSAPCSLEGEAPAEQGLCLVPDIVILAQPRRGRSLALHSAGASPSILARYLGSF